MEKIEELSVKMLYRGILKGMQTYPSTTRGVMRTAILEEVNDWKKLTDPTDIAKATKKMRMLYGHLTMWNIKMEEVNSNETEKVD